MSIALGDCEGNPQKVTWLLSPAADDYITIPHHHPTKDIELHTTQQLIHPVKPLKSQTMKDEETLPRALISNALKYQPKLH
jgi:hypothetical protein